MLSLEALSRRSRGARLCCQMTALLLMSSVGCSGCYQPMMVPPTASIPQTMNRPVPMPLAPVAPIAPIQPTVVPPETPPPELSLPQWEPQTAARDWKYIVLHHTATDSGDVDSINDAHLKNKDKNGKPWLGIGYHFVIGNGQGMGDGEIEPTFRWREQMHGAHAGVADYNQHGIGIVLIGNFEKHAPSDAQIAAVKQLVTSLAGQYGVTSDRIIGHGEVKSTECPGEHFPLSEIRNSVARWIPGHQQQAAAAVPFSRN